MNIKTVIISAAIFGLVAVATQADPLVIDMHYTTAEGNGKKIGTVTERKDRNLLFPQPNMSKL